MNEDKTLSKYTTGKIRAEKAKKELNIILRDENNPFFLFKDTDFAEKYGVSRLTIRNIRANRLNIPPRGARIVQKLKHMRTHIYTINELSEMLNLKYQNLYKIIMEENIPIKPDTPPIESMISHQRIKRAEKDKKIKKKRKRRKSKV